ncbi:LOW QUALITY PROTEIN: growth hormone secretagogue receptor type 1-like [Amphiura filiformis]|uniref:LOW QUALITY PROTEIN: growth hormone secretagogue receptor type 1-like n=1 Tax=Amphiura filiformis TaxID=82378 RepID=UPI003B211C90
MDQNSGELQMNNYSYENSINESIENNTSVYVPYDIPDCPAKSSLVILYDLPEYIIEGVFMYTPTDKVMISTVLPIFTVIGLLTNFAFLLTVVRVREMRTLTNFYLTNLACADLMFIIAAGFNIFINIYGTRSLIGVIHGSATECVITYTSPSIPFFASTLLVTLIGIERFLAICFPLKHRMVNNKSRAIKLVIVTWVTAFALGCVVAPGAGKHELLCVIWPEKYQYRLPTIVNFCSPSLYEYLDIASSCQFAPFIVALVLNTALYALIIRRLSMRDVSETGDGKANQQSQAQKVRNSVARMLVINGIAFFLCLIPFQFIQMYYVLARNFQISLDDKHMYIVQWVGKCLNVLNSAINPLIYSACNARYRQAFFTAIGCSAKKLRQSTERSTGARNTTITNTKL